MKYIDIKEFRETGYLQELNRTFLHPVGLALEVVVEDDGTERLGGIWDCRDDLEGILYAEGELDSVKARTIQKIALHRDHDRKAALGYVVQPVPALKRGKHD